PSPMLALLLSQSASDHRHLHPFPTRRSSDLKYGPGTVTVELKDGYRNMIEKIRPHFHLVETARAAIRAAGLEPEEVPVRGGTDGAVLSWKGLPCPNLGTGGFNFHGVLECITAERMDKATEVILNIVGLYARDPA